MAKKKPLTGSHVVGMDLGGTKILAAVVDQDGRIVAEAKVKTRPEKGPDAVVERMAEAAREAVNRLRLSWDAIRGVGVGAPGPVDPHTGIVYHTPNLPGWEEVPLTSQLGKSLGVPVFLENDVNLGALGEYMLGAGQGTTDMVGIFVGTGIGGGLILDGKLHSGYRHAAAEIGHMILLADGPVCGCGKRGCAEALASRTAIERDIWLGIRAGRKSLIPELTGGEPERLTSGALAQAMRESDPLVSEVVGRAQCYLGLLTASIVNLVDPEMIVFGGGLIEALGDDFLLPIRVTARQYFIQQAGADKVLIVATKLGDHAVVLGAAALARQKAK